MKKIFYYGGVLLLTASLCACAAKPTYKTEYAVGELANELCEELGNTRFLESDASMLADYVDLSEFPNGTVRFSADGNNISEFGIWQVPNHRAEELRALLKSYLESAYARNRSFYDSYIPEETPKLKDAEVAVYGDYVAYAILSPKDKELFFRELEEELRAD